jgi:hypothetical protein
MMRIEVKIKAILLATLLSRFEMDTVRELYLG